MSKPSSEQSAVTGGRIAVGLLIALVLVFALLNSQSVRMHWIITTTTQPLFVVLLVFAGLGLAIGYSLGRRGRSR